MLTRLDSRILSDAHMSISSVFGYPPVQVWGNSNLEDYQQVRRHDSPCVSYSIRHKMYGADSSPTHDQKPLKVRQKLPLIVPARPVENLP